MAPRLFQILLRVLVGAQLVGLVVLAGSTVREFPVWAEIDEKAHFSYVQYIAEDHRLPTLDDLVSVDIHRIAQNTYPDPAPFPREQAGLAGLSYEAFQPPLYYALAAPAFLLKDSVHAKVDVVRAFDALLLLAGVAALYLLARQAFGRDHLLPFAAGLTVLLLPGVVVRGVTISNAALELPLALLLLAVLWRADSTRSRRLLLGAGVLLGLALLTKLTLVYLVPLYLGVVARHLVRSPGRRMLTAVAALLIPVAMLAPWLAFNHDHYGTLTANGRAQEMQSQVLYGKEGGRFPYDAGDLPRKNRELPSPLLPQEWALDRQELDGWVGTLSDVLKLAFLALPALLLVIQPRRLRSREFAFLVLPLVLGLVLMNLTLVVGEWDIFLPRYLHPVLPAFGLFAAVAWRRLLRTDLAALALTGAVSLALAAVWVYLAGFFYYQSLGDALGIG